MSDSSREIENLLYIYAERIDAGDLDGVAELFAHARILGDDGRTLARGREEVRAMYAGTTRIYPATGTPNTQHVITNAIIEVDASGVLATARARFTVFQCLPDFPLQAIVAGRYADRFEWVESAWRFTERQMRVEFVGDLSRHLLIDLATVGGPPKRE